MFDDKRFRSILKSQGGLLAVKYMKTETGLPLKECKAYLDKIVAEPITLVGSITWFKCEYQLPPIVKYGALCDYSEPVFILLENKEIIKTKIVYEKDGTFIGWENNGTPYNPTHWSYINYPED